jgi:hypothetical protein
LIAFNIVGIVGLIMLISSTNNHVKYAATFFYATGVYPNTPQCMAWNGNNVGGSTKRSIALAAQAMVGNLGGWDFCCRVAATLLTMPTASSHPSFSSARTAHDT